MIVSERKTKIIIDRYNEFGDEMKYGRLTEPSDGKTNRLREAILKSKQLGRPLTSEEMKQFEITE